MAAADATEAVIAQMPVEPPPIVADEVVAPPPIAADEVVAPPLIAADAVVTVGTPPPAVADDAEAAAAPMQVVPPPPPPDQKIQAAMIGREDPLQSEIHKVNETIEVQLPSLADDQKPCDMVTDMKESETNHCSLMLPSSDSESYHMTIQKQPEQTVQPLGHFLVEEQPAMVGYTHTPASAWMHGQANTVYTVLYSFPFVPQSIDDRSDDSPTTNSNDDSDHSDGGNFYDNAINRCHVEEYYRFICGRPRRNCGYSCSCNAKRNHWPGDYPFIPGLGYPCNPMTSEGGGHVSRWSSPEPDWGKKRYSVGAGLSNPHWWTCFLNCILQCLVHTVPLVLKLQKADHPDPCPRASIGFCCLCSLKLHADESIRLSGSAFYPESFVNHLKCMFALPNFLFFFAYTSLLLSCIVGCLACKCNRCSDKSEPFLDLSLEVTMVETLMDALESFTKVELIEDFMCDGCKSRVNMEKHFKVEQAPEVLVIHLKRFTNSGAVQVFRHSEASVLDSAAYLLFYVKQGSSPWFSTLLEKEDKFPLDDSVSLAEQGTSEIALANDKEGEPTSSRGQDNSGYCLVGPAEENGNGPNLLDFSQDIQRNGNGNTFSDAEDKLEEGCCLSGMSGGTQVLSCLTGSGDKNGHADGFLEPWEKEDVCSRGSLDTKEMNPITHGPSEVDLAVTQGGSPPKSENICSLLQLSHKYDDNYG
ncbi:hypothetical protein BAE44_0010847, partial [Dichanthelium oligosanthes]